MINQTVHLLFSHKSVVGRGRSKIHREYLSLWNQSKTAQDEDTFRKDMVFLSIDVVSVKKEKRQGMF